MDFKYVDLAKDKNLLAFESGIVCVYPNFYTDAWTRESDDPDEQFGCRDGPHKDWYAERYLDKDEEAPKYYDPRCRPWYYDQATTPSYSTFSDVYVFASGALGITNCVPLWARTPGAMEEEPEYRGAYCLDQYPTGRKNSPANETASASVGPPDASATASGAAFVNKYYREDAGVVDYLIFNADAGFDAGGDVTQSNVTGYVEALVFNPGYQDGEDKRFVVEEMILDDAAPVDALTSTWLDAWLENYEEANGKYPEEKVARLPSEPIRRGRIVVRDNRTEEESNNENEELEDEFSNYPGNYLYVLGNLTIPYERIHEELTEGADDATNKSYTFMLILPARVIEAKVDSARGEVLDHLITHFVLPFAGFSFGLMVLIGLALNRISIHITSPIIELYKNIQTIISAHQAE